MTTPTLNGLTVVELEAGAPLPPEVPTWALRCDLVKTSNSSPLARRWCIAGGAAGSVVSLIVLGLLFHWHSTPASLLLAGSLMALLQGLRPGWHTEIVPSPTGRFLVYADGVPRKLTDREWGTMYVAKGLGLLGMLAGLGGVVFEHDWKGVTTILFGWWFYQFAKGAYDPPLERAEFLALADPTRPLAQARPLAKPGEANPS
jgi:hypothetical protein